MSGLIYTSTRSKSKPKKKPGWQKEQAEYEEWLAKHSTPVTKRKVFAPVRSPVVTGVNVRETVRPPSLVTSGGSTSPVTARQYTGDKIVGIAAMHKSNLVPIFNDDAAKDVASMRR